MEISIIAIVATLRSAIELRKNCGHNRKKSESLIKCLEAVIAPLDAIVDANHDRVQVAHEVTFRKLQDVIDRAKELLEKQTKSQGTVMKALNSSRVRDEFHEIQIALEIHMGALNVSLGVSSGLKIQEGLDIIKQENHGAEQELREQLALVHDNQAITHANQGITHANQGITHDMLNNSRANQQEMIKRLDMLAEQLNVSRITTSNAINNNTYNINNDHSTTTTNNVNNVTNNYQDKRSNVSDSDYHRIAKKPEPYVKRKTKLHVAAEKGDLSEVKEALRTVFIDHENQNGSTALLLAVENKHGELIEYLLLEGVDFQLSANKKSWRKVIERKEQSNIGYFIEAGILQVNIEFEDGWTPLHWCADKGHLEIAQALIDAKADVNAKNEEGFTPLHWCAQEGHLDIARAMINAGAEFDDFEKAEVIRILQAFSQHWPSDPPRPPQHGRFSPTTLLDEEF